MVNKQKVGVIGGGNMGAAIIGGIYRQHNVSVCEMDRKRSQFLKRKFSISTVPLDRLLEESTSIILAVKPQNFEDLLNEIHPHVRDNQLIISIAAGITTKFIEKRLPAGSKIIRTMPNLPAQVKEGVTALAGGQHATKRDLKNAQDLFKAVGSTVIVDEKFIDAITAVSGSGPAYVFLFIECLNKAAKSLGLNTDLSNQIVLQTIKGSIALLEDQGQTASELRQQVTSKGGTTQAALDVFGKNNIEKTYTNALKAAKSRAKELSR